MKSNLIIQCAPLFPTVCIFSIETIEGHVKYHLKNVIKCNNIKWRLKHVQPPLVTTNNTKLNPSKLTFVEFILYSRISPLVIAMAINNTEMPLVKDGVG